MPPQIQTRVLISAAAFYLLFVFVHTGDQHGNEFVYTDDQHGNEFVYTDDQHGNEFVYTDDQHGKGGGGRILSSSARAWERGYNKTS